MDNTNANIFAIYQKQLLEAKETVERQRKTLKKRQSGKIVFLSFTIPTSLLFWYYLWQVWIYDPRIFQQCLLGLFYRVDMFT